MEKRRQKQGVDSFRRTILGLLVASEFTACQNPMVRDGISSKGPDWKKLRERERENNRRGCNF